ncbi:hypothetical protein LY76DRAFT_25595 [Colletotrichum caudatum]|nr:hypothetical protein LY76DRAFT_25595 [Colletotrichum caudatum]
MRGRLGNQGCMETVWYTQANFTYGFAFIGVTVWHQRRKGSHHHHHHHHYHIHGLGCGTQGVGIGETTSKRGFSRLPRRSHVSVFVFSFLFSPPFLRGGFIFFRFSPAHLFLLALSLPIFILAVVPPPLPPSLTVSCFFVFTFVCVCERERESEHTPLWDSHRPRKEFMILPMYFFRPLKVLLTLVVTSMSMLLRNATLRRALENDDARTHVPPAAPSRF